MSMLTNFVRLALQSNQWQFAIQTVLSSSPRHPRGGGGGSAPATAPASPTTEDPGNIASSCHPSSLSSRPLPVVSERGDASLSPVQYAEMARLVVQWLVQRGQTTTTATQRQQEPTSRYGPAGSIALHHNDHEPHHREDWWMGLRLLQHCCARAEEALAGSVNREGYADDASAAVIGALDRQHDKQDPEEVYVLRLSQCRSHLAVLQGAMQKLPQTWEVCLAVLCRSVECLVLSSSSSSPSRIDDRIPEPRQQQQRPKQERQQRERTIHQLRLLLERYAEATRSELRALRRRRRSHGESQPLNSNVVGQQQQQQQQAGPVRAVDDEEATLLNTLRCIDALRRRTQLLLLPSTSGASRPLPQALLNNRDHKKHSITSHHHPHYSENSANVAAHTATTTNTATAASSTLGKVSSSLNIEDTMSYNMMLSTSLQQKRNRHVPQQPQSPQPCSSSTLLVLSWEQALRHFCLGRTKKKQQQTRHKEKDNVDGGASRPNTISLNTLLPLLAESDQEGLVWEAIRFVRRLHNNSSASNSSPATSTMIPHPSHTPSSCGGWWWWYENVSIDAATVKAVAECSVRLQSWQMAMAVLQGKLQPIHHSSNSSQSSTTILTSSRGGDPVGFMMDTNAGAEKRFVSDSAAQCVTDATPQNDAASTSGLAPCSVSTAILCVLTLKESAKWEPCLAWWNSLPEQHPYRQHLLLCSYVASCVAECGRMYCARRAKRAKQQQKVLSAQRQPMHSRELPLSMHHHRRQKGDEVEGPVVPLPSTSTMPQVQWVWQTALFILAGSARHEPAKAMLFAIRALRTARAWDKALGLLVSQLPSELLGREVEGGGTRSSFHNNHNNDHCDKVQDNRDQSEANTTKATQRWTDDAAICREILELLQRKDSAVWIPRHARPVVGQLAERLVGKK